MELIMTVASTLFSFDTLMIMVIGCLVGIIIGAIPGLNGGIGVSILVPFTFSMTPLNGLLLLGGIFMGSTYGGSISSILINIPGTPESFCTGIEGYPLAKAGRGKEALYLAGLSSTFGGIVGVIALIFFTPFLANISLKFGPPEMFLVAIMGLTVVGSLTGKDFYKGLFAAVFGVWLGMIGIDNISGDYRFTFGISSMSMGINLIAVVLGIFSISEMLSQMKRLILKKNKHRDEEIIAELGTIGIKSVIALMFRKPLLIIKSSIIGTIIGILPGTGTAIASFVAYAEVKRTAKGESFGTGNIKGIIAPETANNAAVGGSLVPMMALGIPGSVTSAIMYGAMVLHGLAAGPRLFIDNAPFAYSFVWGMLLIVIIMGLVSIFFAPLFAKVLKLDNRYIIPVVILLSLVGSYSLRNNLFDVLVTIVFGYIGLLFEEFKIPKAPVILGLILSDLIERNFRLSMVIAGAKETPVIMYIITRPVSIVIIILSAFLIYTNTKALIAESKVNK